MDVSVEEAVERMHRIYTEEDEKMYDVVEIKVAITDLNNVLEVERIECVEFVHLFPEGMK